MAEAKKKTILLINKIDLIKKEELAKLIAIYSKEYKFEAVIPISAKPPGGPFSAPHYRNYYIIKAQN